MVDIVAVPKVLPERIIAFLGHPAFARQEDSAAEATTRDHLEKIIVLLRDSSGCDFSLYKANTLLRRIERRIALHQVTDIGGYVRFLRKTPPKSTCSSRSC